MVIAEGTKSQWANVTLRSGLGTYIDLHNYFPLIESPPPLLSLLFGEVRRGCISLRLSLYYLFD